MEAIYNEIAIGVSHIYNAVQMSFSLIGDLIKNAGGIVDGAVKAGLPGLIASFF